MRPSSHADKLILVKDGTGESGRAIDTVLADRGGNTILSQPCNGVFIIYYVGRCGAIPPADLPGLPRAHTSGKGRSCRFRLIGQGIVDGPRSAWFRRSLLPIYAYAKLTYVFH